jgi:FkbM family methyltransferase
MAQGLKLEAEAPALLRFAEIGPFITRQADTSMAQGVAKLNRLGVNQVERSLAHKQCGAGNQQFADQRTQLVEPDDPALIGGQMPRGPPNPPAFSFVSFLWSSFSERVMVLFSMKSPFSKRAALGVVLLLPVLAFGGLVAGSLVAPAGAARFIIKTRKTLEAMPYKATRLLRRVGILKPVQTRAGPGFVMEVDPLEQLGESVLVEGRWGPHVSEAMAAVLKEGSVFVDVGAHIGYYSLEASKLVGPSGRVIAVEPNPPIVDKLRRNIKLNEFTNVKVYEAACTDKTARLRFFPSPEERSLWSSLSPKNSGGEDAIEVDGMPLDSIAEIEKLPRMDLVKIDVEGAEMQVLRGMEKILTTFRPRLIMELKSDALDNLGASMEEVLSLLRQHGYKRAQTLDFQDSVWAPDPGWKKSNRAATP